MPQGSIIGPVLFLLCINDLEIVCQNTQSNFFDDDANLRTSISKENTLDNLLNKDLYRIQDWLSDNHSSLHIDKSIILRYRGKSKSRSKFIRKKIEQKGCLKFFGVYIDKTPETNEHFSYKESKLSQSIGIVSNLGHSVSRVLLLACYNFYLKPVIQNENLIYGRTKISRFN